MDKNKFSQSELQELETLEVRGGTSTSDTAQYGCTNSVPGCGANTAQIFCVNESIACGSSLPPLQGNC